MWADLGATRFRGAKATAKASYTPTSNSRRGCDRLPTGQSQWSAEPGASPVFLYFTTVECDKLIEASIGSALNENPKIAGTLGVSITDFSIARSDPRNPTNLAVDTEKKQIEEARKTKAKL